MSEDPTYVYIFNFKDQDAPCKVGITNNIGSRIHMFQTGSPYEIECHEAYKFPNRKIAFAVEYEVHKSVEDLRLKGEWFDMPAHHLALGLHVAAKKVLNRFFPNEEECDDVYHEAITWNE